MYDLGMVVWCAWMIKCVSKIGSGGVIECKGLEIRPIRGGYMLTNQRRVYDDQSEEQRAGGDDGGGRHRQ